MTRAITINLAELSDDSLACLLSEISGEMNMRIKTRIEENRYEPLNEEERTFVYDKQNVEAIKAYRNRTGHCLRESKAVVDSFRHYLDTNV